MSVVTFISDMGYNSINLSIAKAKFYGRFNLIPLMDIAHDVEYSDVNEAAFILRKTISNFPPQSIHLLSIRGDVGKNAPLIITKTQDQFIISLDNGAPSLIADENASYHLVKDQNRDEKKLAVLLMNTAIELIDNHYNLNTFTEETTDVHLKQWPVPVMGKNSLNGTVMYTDFHGNAFTNIRLSDINEFTKGKSFRINLSLHEWVSKIEKNTEAVSKGEISIITDDNDFLIVTIHAGNAEKLLGLRKGKTIKVEIAEDTLL